MTGADSHLLGDTLSLLENHFSAGLSFSLVSMLTQETRGAHEGT